MTVNGNFLLLDRVDSTNTYGKTHFAELADGTMIAAKEQFSGRGRLGRAWITPPGTALTASVILKNIEKPFHAGCIVSLAALQMVRELLPESFVFFKWPNDIYIRSSKLAGVLSEGIVSGGRVSGVVCGIGINVNQSSSMLSEIPSPATSMANECGKAFDLDSLYSTLYAQICSCYQLYLRNHDEIIQMWRSANALVGQKFDVIDALGTTHHGTFCAIGVDGEMHMQCSDGTLRKFDCADVKIDTGSVDFENMEAKAGF